MAKKKNTPNRLTPYNPLDKKHLGESVAEALLETRVLSLPPNEAFVGAGIYAIYYTGDFEVYKDIQEANKGGRFSWPIYVGKAVPAGARKGGFGLGADPGQVLYRRLDEHSKSINQTENLSVEDFGCRFLVVDDIWIPLAEALLIEKFVPIWNKEIDGFGNHDPGSGRRNQQKSLWDVLHPGRPWANKLQPNRSDVFQVRERVGNYIAATKGQFDD